jgi:Putative metallopeptidase
MKRILCAAVVAVAPICLFAQTGLAQVNHLKPNPWTAPSKVSIVYGPAGDQLRPIRDWMVQTKILERVQLFLAPLQLKQNLTVQAAECGKPTQGRHYSFMPYVPGKPVTICYEFIQLVAAFAPVVNAQTTNYGLIGRALVTREMAIEGPIVQEVLHDVALAVFDQLEIPVWGKVEDAADNVAALSMMYFGKDVALKSVLGSAYFLEQVDHAISAQKNQSGQVVGYSYDTTYLADIRPPMLQRYYNLLCMAVGSDPVLFSALIAFPPAKPSVLEFSWQKAQECRRVYREAAEGFKALILDKYVNKDMLAQLKNVNWFGAP